MLTTRKTHSGIPAGTVAGPFNGKTAIAEEGESIWSLLNRLRKPVYGGEATRS